MLRLAIKIFALYLLWALVVKPIVFTGKGTVSGVIGFFQNIYWWMSPFSDGW